MVLVLPVLHTDKADMFQHSENVLPVRILKITIYFK
jgi:hypothetical protein